ncbi:MAG: MFS transporter [Muribaculaceae bacterium]|nr:MFS transporter [Muribaculaceae bacterium]
MKRALLALSLGTFALGIAEFVVMGILVNISRSLGISVTQGGHIISAYATGVCLGALGLLMLRRMPLHKLMIMLAAVIGAGNLLASLAPGYHMLLVARFISGLPHGAYFGVGAIVARRLARPGHEVEAVSIMIAGMTVANLVGVPLGTMLANMLSWRIAFVGAALSGITTFVLLRLWLPPMEPLPDHGLRSQFHFLRTLPPWLIFGAILIGQTGIYCWYSYIDPLLTFVTGFRAADLGWLMLVSGLGMFAGNLWAGRLSLRFKPALIASLMLAGAALLLLAIWFGCRERWLMVPLLFACTTAMFGSGGPLQSSIVVYSRGGEMLGASLIQIAYNAGNAMAAAIGGAIIHTGAGYAAPCLAGIPLAAIGALLLFLLYWRTERHEGVAGPTGGAL